MPLPEKERKMTCPYIGVTGFMSRQETDQALDVFDALPERSDRLLMIGVLASSKTLCGKPVRLAGRYPKPENISRIFPPHRRSLNLIHYHCATDEVDTLQDQLKQLIKLGGKNLDGFQLNIPWPDPKQIKFLRGHRVVLQIGPRSLEMMDGQLHFLFERVNQYEDVVTDVLIDASAGNGIPFDPQYVTECLEGLILGSPFLKVGVAGGLSAETISRLQSIRIRFSSVDAEGALRTPDDQLDLVKVNAYVAAASDLLYRRDML